LIDAIARLRGRAFAYLLAVCLLCTLPYWRSLGLPPISDDYLQVWLGRHYGPMEQWHLLAQDSLYRCRATSIWLTGVTEAVFGFSTVVFNLQSMLLHALNVALIILLGRWRPIGFTLSVPAALLWGLLERHHEAVMWYAALPEQLVFFFVLLALLCWLEWWQSGKLRFYAGAIFAFLLALLSKESAVILCPLLALPALFDVGRWREALVKAIPFWLLSLVYFTFNILTRNDNLHWNDGTFQLGFHFIPVIVNSTARLLFPWGFAALAVLLVQRKKVRPALLIAAVVWIPICLAPYAFIAYQPRVPSRHVYLASLGVALIIAMAFQIIYSHRRLLAHALLVVYLFANTSYVWIFKHDQFMQRALVTERLVESAAKLSAEKSNPRLQVFCFPLAPEIAVIALSHHLGLRESDIVVNKSSEPNCQVPTVQLIQ
jgi:hypothetical protein